MRRVCLHACKEAASEQGGTVLLISCAHNYHVPELAFSLFFLLFFGVKTSILIAITFTSSREATGEQSHFLHFVLGSLLSHDSV